MSSHFETSGQTEVYTRYRGVTDAHELVAVHRVLQRATDPQDACRLLDMLGLLPAAHRLKETP